MDRSIGPMARLAKKTLASAPSSSPKPPVTLKITSVRSTAALDSAVGLASCKTLSTRPS